MCSLMTVIKGVMVFEDPTAYDATMKAMPGRDPGIHGMPLHGSSHPFTLFCEPVPGTPRFDRNL